MKRNEIYFVYMIRCRGGYIYTGVTNDVGARYKAHREGKGAKFTRMYPPVDLMFVERIGTRGKAQRVEAAIKRLSPNDKERVATGLIRVKELVK